MNTFAMLALVALMAVGESSPHSEGLFSGQSIVSDKSVFVWGPTRNGLSLGVDTAGPYIAKQPMSIILALRNSSGRTRFIGQPSLNYAFVLTDASGRVVPMRSDVSFVSGGSIGSNTLSIGSGDAIEESFDFARFYSVNAGHYKLVVSLTLEEGTSETRSTRLAPETLTAAPVAIQIYQPER